MSRHHGRQIVLTKRIPSSLRRSSALATNRVGAPSGRVVTATRSRGRRSSGWRTPRSSVSRRVQSPAPSRHPIVSRHQTRWGRARCAQFTSAQPEPSLMEIERVFRLRRRDPPRPGIPLLNRGRARGGDDRASARRPPGAWCWTRCAFGRALEPDMGVAPGDWPYRVSRVRSNRVMCEEPPRRSSERRWVQRIEKGKLALKKTTTGEPSQPLERRFDPIGSRALPGAPRIARPMNRSSRHAEVSSPARFRNRGPASLWLGSRRYR